MAQNLIIANQKGGVGKTTTAVNLGAGLARMGYRTLLVDLDIQGSATANLLGPIPPEQPSVVEMLTRQTPVDRCVVQTSTDNLLLAPARQDLAGVDLLLAGASEREHVLSRCLNTALVRDTQVVIIDTAPYLGLLTINALVAAHQLLVPVCCEYLPIVGLKLFNDTLQRLRAELDAPCPVLGYLLTMVDRRERITNEVEALLEQRFGRLLFETRVRINTRFKASPSHRQTIFQYEGNRGRGRQDYTALAREVAQRLALPRVRSQKLKS